MTKDTGLADTYYHYVSEHHRWRKENAKQYTNKDDIFTWFEKKVQSLKTKHDSTWLIHINDPLSEHTDADYGYNDNLLLEYGTYLGESIIEITHKGTTYHVDDRKALTSSKESLVRLKGD